MDRSPFRDLRIVPESSRESTLAALDAAVASAPPDLGAAALAARLRAAVPFGVEIANATIPALAAILASPTPQERIGAFTPADIDRLTSDWRSLRWRLLPESPLSPHVNVALDEVLVDGVAAGLCPPTLRFWGWSSPAVVIGRTQSLANEVDLSAAAELGMTVVRRMSGGGTMFVEPRGAITYSLVVPESAVAGLTIRQSYEVCDAWVVRALRRLGVDCHHVPVNDLAWAEGKIGGAAQARRKGVVLHHTTLAYDLRPADMTRVLRLGRERLHDRGTASAAKVVSPLTRQTTLPREMIVDRLMEELRSAFPCERSVIANDELGEAERLVREKYATDGWLRTFE